MTAANDGMKCLGVFEKVLEILKANKVQQKNFRLGMFELEFKMLRLLKNYEQECESVRKIEKVWESVRKYEYVWESVKNCKKVWESMKKCEKVWESM